MHSVFILFLCDSSSFQRSMNLFSLQCTGLTSLFGGREENEGGDERMASTLILSLSRSQGASERLAPEVNERVERFGGRLEDTLEASPTNATNHIPERDLLPLFTAVVHRHAYVTIVATENNNNNKTITRYHKWAQLLYINLNGTGA